MTRQPLWVILCRLPEKGRKEIEEIVVGMKERDREETSGDEREGQGRKRNRNESEETEESRIPWKALSHLLGQKSQEPQSECGY